MNLKEKLSLLPKTSGIYKFKNENNTVLYVGKAKNLYNRVNSYFSKSLIDRPRLIPMIDQISDIEIIETQNEIEALVLEAAIVKKLQPKYNSDLKDDKSYAYLYINHKDVFPTVKILRNFYNKDIKNGKLFGPFPNGRSVKIVFKFLRRIYPFCTSKDPTKPCFNSQIGLCPGVVTKEVYNRNIKGIIKFLEGKDKNLIQKIEIEMKTYSDNREYEKAAVLRDKLYDLKYLSYKIDTKNTFDESDYLNKKEIKAKQTIKLLAKELLLPNLNRIECYDISNINGQNAYGSMTVAINGMINSNEYRIFKIKSINTPNDYEMLKEVIIRRLKHLTQSESTDLGQKPDLILIDGGLGQLNKLKSEIPQNISVLGITKGRKYKRKGARLKDEFYLIKEDNIELIKLKNTQILSRLRDEAHRFAILHYRKSKLQSQTKSVLDNIPLVGPKTKKLLKMNYTVDELRKENKENLLKLIKNKRIVNSITKYFTKTKKD